MVTIIPGVGGLPDQYIYTIKPGGTQGGDCDYVSLNNWESGTRSNLVTQNRINIAEVYGGGNAGRVYLLTYSGYWITDATRYIEIRAASGHEHNGVWDTNKAYMSESGANSTMMNDSYNTKVSKMQIQNIGTGHTVSQSTIGYSTFNRCIIRHQTGLTNVCAVYAYGTPITVTNCVILERDNTAAFLLHTGGASGSILYNSTVISANTGLTSNTVGISFTGQNNYISAPTCYAVVSWKGSNDATSTAEAINANLRNVPYSTATFFNVTTGSENLRLVVSASNKLLDNGANLTSSGVTTDVIGTARPQNGAFDIGAFENDIPLCWNYTAQYKNSSKLFKASGCGSFPKSLRVPSNIDTSTGRMVDDGILINPDEYRIV